MSPRPGVAPAASTHHEPSATRAAITLAAVSAALLAVRLYAADHVGFGDGEALYACYALHPQPAYLDHPGLIALVGRAIGRGDLLEPRAVHEVTAVLATLVPWALALAARACGASWRRSILAGLALVAAPEIAFGLFALTPDLPLAFAWIGALGLAGAGLRARPASNVAATALLFAGTLAGVACVAKVSGVLLAASLVAVYLSAPARAHARTAWPWLGLALGGLVALPVAAFEVQRGFPLLAHRLVDTQHGAGLSFRNAGALVGGQLAYVSPVLLVAAGLVARALVRARRDDDAVTRLLLVAWAVPFVFLAALCLWSRVAEPHWLAPSFLALPIFAAVRVDGAGVSRRLGTVAVVSGLALSAAAHAWVLVPASATLLPASADPALDIANELVGWPEAARATRDFVDQARASDPDAVVAIVGPFYTVCAQLEARLAHDARVGCDDPMRDDFDDWLPRPLWARADALVFVTDNRFPTDLAARFPDRYAVRSSALPVLRGGRVVRTFRITLLLPRATG